jgi:hypothetical protein
MPSAAIISDGLLLGPHVVECGASVVAESPTLCVVAGKDQRIENRFGSAGLISFAGISWVAIVRANIIPEPDALGDIIDQLAFSGGGTLFGERRA